MGMNEAPVNAGRSAHCRAEPPRRRLVLAAFTGDRDMADGNNTASGVGMGMIIGLLLVLLIMAAAAYVLVAGRGASPGQAVSDAGHTVSGTVNVK
jgi:hypothetical protein